MRLTVGFVVRSYDTASAAQAPAAVTARRPVRALIRRVGRGLRDAFIRRSLGAPSRVATPAEVARQVRLQRMSLAAWQPQQQMLHARNEPHRPAVPAIDVHNHLGRWLNPDGSWMARDVAAVVRVLDESGMRAVVNLDGRWGDELTANLDRFDRAFPGRFVTFCHVDWSLLHAEDGQARLLRGLEDSVRRGARGLKVWKDVGLGLRDTTGALVLPDDPRVHRVMARAGELGLPVLIHTADPKAFFAPVDRSNERLEELVRHPEWWVGDTTRYPTFDRLLSALETLVVGTPGTRFIGAHLGGAAEELDRVEALMDRAPNWSVDLGGRLAEIGRQPRRFRALVERHPDRVLFGSDAFPPTVDDYRIWFRFLETADESFDYAPGHVVPPQGRWTVSGAALPRPLLEAVYAGNAARLLGL